MNIFAKKKRAAETPEQKRYRHRVNWIKAFLYLVWILSTIVMFTVSFLVFDNKFIERVNPQIDRAIIQVARLLPEMEKDEASLREAYDKMVQSWEEISSSDAFKNYGGITHTKIDARFEDVVGDTLSWLNRVTKLKVGQDGLVTVISKDTDRIVAHPDQKLVGGEFKGITDSVTGGSSIVSVEAVNELNSQDELDISYNMMFPFGRSFGQTLGAEGIVRSVQQSIYGAALEYGDYYIVCGIPAMEYASSVLVHALLVSCIYLILMWLFVRWICLVMNTRRETFKAMRNKLVSCTVLGCLLFLVVCWYVQRLSTVAENLKTMARHADVAVETLNAYEEQRKKLNDFFDEFYLIQCEIASMLIQNEGAKSLTWEDLQRYADTLQIKYVYLFDKDGKVVVTNAPYDTMTISTDSEDFTNQFRRVLEGVEYLVLDPMKDEWRNEYIQYIAVNLRDENNLNAGLVLIGVDPTLRDRLLKPLNVDTVLENLVIGLPDDAIAVDKETMRIAATTGLGYKGDSIEELGISPEVLTDDFSGFLRINGRDYYAAVSDSAQYHLMPVLERSGGLGDILLSLKLTLVALAACALVLLIALIPYQKVVIDGAPEKEEEDEPETDPDEGKDMSEEDEGGLFSGIQTFLKTQQKKGLEDRWHMNDIPRDQLTPEQRISKSLYRILLLFCLVILLPTLYSTLEGRADPNRLNSLAYVISGNWQKGLNIFAVTSCIFLLCAMYVVVVLVNQILYRIAKISDMRIETVCLLIKNAIKYICVIVFIYYGLSRFGVQTQTLLASAGIFSMMIGFGAKDLVSDIVAGFFTIVEGTYKVGDFVTIGSWSGTVVEIGLRTTKVQSFSDTKVFNNSAIREVINANGEVARMTLKVPISYEADLNRVEAILNEELPKMMNVLPGLVKPPVYEGVDGLGDSSVDLRIAIFVQSRAKFRAIRILTKEIKLLFDREGIEIPYNQLVLHNAKEVLSAEKTEKTVTDTPVSGEEALPAEKAEGTVAE